MTDYDKPDDDPVVAEVRCIREALFAEYNYDLTAYCEEMMRRQATSGARYATPADRPATPASTDTAKKVG
jgi:hypothetical protein